jgi:O-antigen/teichoic acid export membrane protein
MWLQTLNGIVLQQLDRLVIGALVGAVAVGYYSVCLQLVQTAHLVLSRASAFIFPLVVRYREENRKEMLWKLFKQGMILTTIAGWLMSGGLLVFGGNFLAVWMGPGFALKATLTLQILAIWSAFLATSIMQFYFLNATGNERLNTVLGGSSSVAFLIAGIFLIQSLGVTGAAWARLLSYSPALVASSIICRRCFNDRRWYVGILLLLPTGVAVTETLLFNNSQMVNTAGGLCMKMILFGIAGASCAAVCWLIYGRMFRLDLGLAEPDPFIGKNSRNALP